MEYKKLNNISGWIVFGIALVVYALCIEPTASFWDCGEYISCAFKLQVPHPPGAPFFLLVGRMFSMLAGELTDVAYWVNMLSAVSSAFAVLFLFWTITMLARKSLGVQYETPSTAQTVGIMGSAAIGSLAFTFSDTFWFSAAEAEVYALSMFFTAFVFWAILKWEHIENQQKADRWLILITYMMGLSIGVHLLNLTALPALALVIYFKKYEPSAKGIIYTLALSAFLIGFIMVGIIQGIPSLTEWFEITFVNSFGLPFGSGVVFMLIALIAALVYGIRYSIKHQKRILNLALLCTTFILLGYSCYAVIVIRSNFDPPIDENDPETVTSFLSYLKREQYGTRPLLHGAYFTADVVEYKQGDPLYKKGEDKYIVYDHKTDPVFNDEHKTLFPRAYSHQGHHAKAYRNWMDIDKGEKPSFGQNLKYFFNYQLNVMYWRYFFWNFAGRQNDIQGHGLNDLKGNWLSGIKPIDELRLGDQDNLPETVKENKARNKFYLLPFILGLMGVYYHARKHKTDTAVVATLFFFTGIGIVLYLNQPPIEPRERDYTLVGSFYAFSIWIGLGVLMAAEAMQNLFKRQTLTNAMASLVCLVVPGIMAAEGWDDHDRSNRYYSVDSAKNLLNSCAKNAILFTGGDNDTFPVWYAQEVEGFRTDVRVCNLSLLNTDWYIGQMKRRAYKSPPLPITLQEDDFQQGTNDYIPPRFNRKGKPQFSNQAMYIDKYVQMVKNENKQILSSPRRGAGRRTILPTKKLILEVDSQKVLDMGIVPPDKRDKVVSQMQWKLPKNTLHKRDLIILDMIANNNWERPIYFSSTLSRDSYLGLRSRMQLEGNAMRLLPYKSGAGGVATDTMYRRMMNDFYWRELDNPDVYYNQDYQRFAMNARRSFLQLSEALYNEGKEEKARKAIMECLNKIPDETFPHDIFSSQFVPLLFDLGEDKKALEMAKLIGERSYNEVGYMAGKVSRKNRQLTQKLVTILRLQRTLKDNGYEEEASQFNSWLTEHMNLLPRRYQQFLRRKMQQQQQQKPAKPQIPGGGAGQGGGQQGQPIQPGKEQKQSPEKPGQ